MFSRLIAKDYQLGLVRLRAVLDPSAPKLDVTEVQGSYDFMELAWHTAMGHLRMVKR